MLSDTNFSLLNPLRTSEIEILGSNPPLTLVFLSSLSIEDMTKIKEIARRVSSLGLSNLDQWTIRLPDSYPQHIESLTVTLIPQNLELSERIKEIAVSVLRPTSLELLLRGCPKEIKEQIDLINRILTKGLLTRHMALDSGVNRIGSGDNVSDTAALKERDDFLQVNLLFEKNGIKDVLYAQSRGSISVVIEREEDNLPRRPKLSEEELDAQNPLIKHLPLQQQQRLRQMSANETVLAEESLTILSNRAHRSILVVSDIDHCGSGLNQADRPNLTGKELEEFLRERFGHCDSREFDYQGCMDSSCIIDLAVSDELRPYQSLLRSPEKITFVPTVTRNAWYYHVKIPSEKVTVNCPNYEPFLNSFYDNAPANRKRMLILHIVRSPTK